MNANVAKVVMFFLRACFFSLPTKCTRKVGENINDDATYQVEIITIFKGEPTVEYANEITVVTGGNSALCGVYFEIGEEYLIDLWRSESTGDLRSGLCGITQTWSSVSKEDQALLTDGCDSVDMCGGICDEFQV